MCCGEGGTLRILLACVWSDLSVWALLGLPPLMACMLSLSILLRLQVALQGNCPNWALHFVHFPGLTCSGSGSQVLHKGTDSVGCAFCALPKSVKLRRPGVWQGHCPQWTVFLNLLPGLSCSVFWVHHKSAISGVLCVSSGELISGCDFPGRCHLSRIPGRVG